MVARAVFDVRASLRGRVDGSAEGPRVTFVVRTRRIVHAVLALLLLAGAAGCGTSRFVRLRDEPYNPLVERFKLSTRGEGRPSQRTIAFLHSRGAVTKGRPETLLAAAREVHVSRATPESTHALAELNYLVARRNEYWRPDAAMEYYFDAMAASYGYLFHSRFGPVRNPYDPQFRGACDLYNSSLERLLRVADEKDQFRPGEMLQLPLSGRRIEFVITDAADGWKPRHYKRFRFVSDYDVEGLRSRHVTRGLGVPLIAVRRTGTEPPAMEQYYADDLSFPVTAFVRFHESGEYSSDQPRCALELHDPLHAPVIQVSSAKVPLESDLSTPLAWFLDRPQFRYLDTLGLVRPDKVDRHRGLYMVQPYQPDKIPVLMVHGVWSSPMTWMDMLNDLMSRPEIREKYQFWFYLYPTGEPFWYAAADLRDDLREVRDVFDSRGHSRALDNMVVVGHSMGGLMSRLLTMESDDRYWTAVSDVPFGDVAATDDVREQIQRVYFFEPQRSVGRVITIATPYQGSDYVNGLTQWLARSLIWLPRRTLDTMKHVFRSGGRNDSDFQNPTSFDGLAPRSPILQAMHQSRLSPGVRYHNIVAVKDRSDSDNLTDGVVTYGSAHRDDVVSERVVEATHSQVQRHPDTIAEVYRVLMQHAAEVSRSGSLVIPAVGSRPLRDAEPVFDLAG